MVPTPNPESSGPQDVGSSHFQRRKLELLGSPRKPRRNARWLTEAKAMAQGIKNRTEAMQAALNRLERVWR
jgi:hypothetical protein